MGDIKWVNVNSEGIIRTDSTTAEMVNQLLEENLTEEVWEILSQREPDLTTRLSYARIQTERKQALEEFEQNLNMTRDERWWQNFFEANPWIFGYGLRYQFLKTVETQPYAGGKNVSGSGGQNPDFLERTEGERRFTVLVEIKRPDARLVEAKNYRNGVAQISKELVGGVSQLQVNCRTWDLDGSRTESNRERFTDDLTYTVQPRGILVIGRLGQLSRIDVRNTFELYRRNTSNPEIITFDELYERARYIVDSTKSDSKE